MIILKNCEETEDQSSIKLIDPHTYSNKWAQHNVLSWCTLWNLNIPETDILQTAEQQLFSELSMMLFVYFGEFPQSNLCGC